MSPPKKPTDIAASLARATLDDPGKTPCKRVRLTHLDADIAHQLGLTSEARTIKPGDGLVREIRVVGAMVLFALEGGACVVINGWGYAEL